MIKKIPLQLFCVMIGGIIHAQDNSNLLDSTIKYYFYNDVDSVKNYKSDFETYNSSNQITHISGYSYQNNLDLFTEAIARMNMTFDQKMRFHFSCHFNSPFAALGQDILHILIMNLPVVLNLIPTFITAISFLFIESDQALTDAANNAA